MPSDPSSRLFVFGWDAADWAVIEAGWREGRLQNLRAIVERGQSGTAMSTIPPITPLAFTSFLTGTDPGEHGIFGFVTRGEGYEYLPVPGGARKVPTLIRRLDQAGYRTALVTFPYTYPAEPLEHGIVVPGWDDPEETFDSVHPPEVGRALAEVVPKIPRRVNIRAAIPLLFAKMTEGTELKQRIARWVIDRADPQVFAMVFSETDHASHRFWVEGDPPRELIDVYDMVDTTMGGVMKDIVREEDTVLVVSDHGSWPIHHFVHVAPLLAEAGYLRRASREDLQARRRAHREKLLVGRLSARDKRRTMFFDRMDWPNTKAFPLGDDVMTTGIYVNQAPLPMPAVAPDEYEDVRTGVTEFLSKVKDPDTGEPVFATVARREDVYHGAAVHLAPDIIVDGVDGYSPQLGRILDFRALFSRTARGGHRREGIYAVNGNLGLDPVEPIEGLFPKVLSALSFQVAERGEVESQLSEGYTEEQAREIELRLQGLGYME